MRDLNRTECVSSTHKYTPLCFVFIAIANHVEITTLLVFSRLEAQASWMLYRLNVSTIHNTHWWRAVTAIRTYVFGSVSKQHTEILCFVFISIANHVGHVTQL